MDNEVWDLTGSLVRRNPERQQHPVQFIVPVSLVLSDILRQAVCNGPIGSFGYAIGLRAVWRRHPMID